MNTDSTQHQERLTMFEKSHRGERIRQARKLPCLTLTLLLGTTLGYGQGSDPAAGLPRATGTSLESQLRSAFAQAEDVHSPDAAAISPDGQWIAWTSDGDIHLAPYAEPARKGWVTACGGSERGEESEFAWSPDSRYFAFLSNCNSRHEQGIYIGAPGSGEAPHLLVNLRGQANSLAWSPDGSQIGFLYTEGSGASAGWEEWAPKKPLSGVIGEGHEEAQRIAIVDSRQGTLDLVTPASLHVYEFDWSPDSGALAYIAAHPPGEQNWWSAQLYTQPVAKASSSRAGGALATAEPHVVVDPARDGSPLHGMQLAVPRWSPDGKRIAFIGGLMSDRGLTGGDIYLVSRQGSDPVDITPHRKASPAWIIWTDDATLQVAETAGGSSHLFAYDVDTRRELTTDDLRLNASILPEAPRMSFSMARNRRIALILNSFVSPPEVWAGPVRNLKQITHDNDAFRPSWGKADSITWRNDSFDIQGWLIEPVGFDAHRSYPMIVIVHGGPAWASTPSWASYYRAITFSAAGYFVFLPNPRGSFGEGERFTQANRRDFGYGDLRDILTGIDVVSKQYPIDSRRIGITGWSYGGFLTMFAITQTHRFRAAVAGPGISDWQSYYGENFISGWMPPYFGTSVYDDPAVYARSSAIDFVKQAGTPTLFAVGNADGECPMTQSLELWQGLRHEHVPTQLVVYPNEGHAFAAHEHRLDFLERSLAWFQQYMPPEQDSSNKRPPAAATNAKVETPRSR